jgi:hypothetical protein
VPLLPIDLQTLFSQSNQVGKEQAVQKNTIPQHQELQGAMIAQKSVQRDNTVTQAQNAEEGAESIRDREKRRRSRRPARTSAPAEAGKKALPHAEAFSDPALGRKIDITG